MATILSFPTAAARAELDPICRLCATCAETLELPPRDAVVINLAARRKDAGAPRVAPQAGATWRGSAAIALAEGTVARAAGPAEVQRRIYRGRGCRALAYAARQRHHGH